MLVRQQPEMLQVVLHQVRTAADPGSSKPAGLLMRDRYQLVVIAGCLLVIVASFVVSGRIHGPDRSPVTVKAVRVELPDRSVLRCDVTYGDNIEFANCEEGP